MFKERLMQIYACLAKSAARKFAKTSIRITKHLKTNIHLSEYFAIIYFLLVIKIRHSQTYVKFLEILPDIKNSP